MNKVSESREPKMWMSRHPEIVTVSALKAEESSTIRTATFKVRHVIKFRRVRAHASLNEKDAAGALRQWTTILGEFQIEKGILI